MVEEVGTGSYSLKGFNWKGTQLRLGTRARGLSRRDGWSLALAMSLKQERAILRKMSKNKAGG